MTAAPITADPHVRVPPRYWWTKRIIAACLGMLLALAGAWGIWWKVAQSRLADEIRQIQARGEPILPSDFELSPVPDDQNAAEYFTMAAAAVNPKADSPRASDMEYPAYLPMSGEWYAMAEKARNGNWPALALVRQAKQFSGVDWKIRYKTPMINTLLSGLNGMRHLANLVGDVALYEHLQGNDAEALVRLEELFHLSMSVDQEPVLVSHLVSIGILAMGIQDISVISPALRIEGDPNPPPPATQPTTQPARPASRQQVQAMIQLLLARATENRLIRPFQFERAEALDTIESQTQNNLLLRPLYRLDAAHGSKMLAPVIQATSQPAFTDAVSGLNTPNFAAAMQWKNNPTWTTMMSATFMPSLNRAIETDFRVRAEAAMAAVQLAVRLYRIDHGGAYPPNLAALVPAYLPAVPVDPFSPKGGPLGYVLLNGGQRPMVYSVGPDGIDHTAKGAVPPADPQVDYHPKTTDQWRDLSRFDPP